MGEKQVYIVLTNTGTFISQVIKLYTGNELTHVSIAFDAELKEVYSFGRKQRHNPLSGGFKKEKVMGDLIRCEERPTLCAVYSYSISEVLYRRIRKRVKEMEKNRDSYRYNFAGILGLILNIKIERRNAYFCSQFVASLFEDHGVQLIAKDSIWVKPADFQQCGMLTLMYSGDLRDAVPISEECCEAAASL